MSHNEDGKNDLIDEAIYDNQIEDTDDIIEDITDDNYNEEGINDLIDDAIYENMVADDKDDICQPSDYQRILERER